jgi:hypothetical protein
MTKPIRKPFVRVYYCQPSIVEGKENRSYSLVNLTVNGLNVASSEYLYSFKYTYENQGEDSADLVLNINTHKLNLSIFKEGVRLGVVFGYEGEARSNTRDMVIKKVSGKYTQSGYNLSLSLIPYSAWVDQFSYEGDIEEQLAQMGAYIQYEYYNAESGDMLSFKYIPSNQSLEVTGEVKDRFTPKEKKKSPIPEGDPLRASTSRKTWAQPHFLLGAVEAINTSYINTLMGVPDNIRKHIHERVEQALLRVLHGFAEVPDFTKRDDTFQLKESPEKARSIRVYSVGPSEKFEQCISFSFEAGKVTRTEDEEAEIEYKILDAANKEHGGVNISRKWRIINPETFAFAEYSVKKVGDDYYYSFDGSQDMKLSPQEVLRLKKVELKENYNKYNYGLRPQDINPDAEPELYNSSNVMARNRYADTDIENHTLKNLSAYQDLPAKAFLNQAIPTSTRTTMNPSGIHTESSARKFVKRVNVNAASKEQLLGKMVKRKTDAMFSNITCEITIEGDPYLECSFNFVVANAGTPLSGKFHAKKVVQNITSGKFTTAVHGALIPQDVETVIQKTSESLEESIKEIEIQHRVFGLMAMSLNWELGPTHAPSRMDNYLTGFNSGVYSSKVKKVDNPAKPQGKPTTHAFIANSPEELNSMQYDPVTRREMGLLELSSESINRNADRHNTRIEGTLKRRAEISEGKRDPFEGVGLTSSMARKRTKFQQTYTTVPTTFFKEPSNE